MQRSAVQRIGDVIALVCYGVFLVYDLRWDIAYTYEVFWLHQPLHLFDLVLFLFVTLLIGYWWVVNLWTLLRYHTFPWFFRNLGVYGPLVVWHLREKLTYRFWYGLVLVSMWAMRNLLIVASWVTSRAYPGRGMTFHIDFEDERDFKNMVRTAQEDGLPLNASVNGVPVTTDDYEVHYRSPNYPSPTYDADILDTTVTFPVVSPLHVVDAPTPHTDD